MQREGVLNMGSKSLLKCNVNTCEIEKCAGDSQRHDLFHLFKKGGNEQKKGKCKCKTKQTEAKCLMKLYSTIFLELIMLRGKGKLQAETIAESLPFWAQLMNQWNLQLHEKRWAATKETLLTKSKMWRNTRPRPGRTHRSTLAPAESTTLVLPVWMLASRENLRLEVPQPPPLSLSPAFWLAETQLPVAIWLVKKWVPVSGAWAHFRWERCARLRGCHWILALSVFSLAGCKTSSMQAKDNQCENVKNNVRISTSFQKKW